MFSKQEIDAYKSITAPDVLAEKVKMLSAKRKVPVMTIVKYASALAACLAIVVAINMFLKTQTMNIVLNGYELESSVMFYDVSPAADMRTSPIFSVPVELDIEEKTDIRVSHGNLSIDGENPTEQVSVSKPVMIWWNISRSEEMPRCVMEIKTDGEMTLITLEFDNVEKTITAKRTTK